ncbi:pr95.1 [rat cytomegalovirus strain Maastricht]|uniref:Pr95.1 n=1 Tax=Rat cytomegalovirus (strain Maastricht) TaxID=79700 RepID=Q9DWA5_RCMVM|nr:pr95.1 [rat cytomegalovirus strain Maastricht]AAF99185.1 pr95.1 [rat cytomegalovirus strain Maastricht]
MVQVREVVGAALQRPHGPGLLEDHHAAIVVGPVVLREAVVAEDRPPQTPPVLGVDLDEDVHRRDVKVRDAALQVEEADAVGESGEGPAVGRQAGEVPAAVVIEVAVEGGKGDHVVSQTAARGGQDVAVHAVVHLPGEPGVEGPPADHAGDPEGEQRLVEGVLAHLERRPPVSQPPHLPEGPLADHDGPVRRVPAPAVRDAEEVVVGSVHGQVPGRPGLSQGRPPEAVEGGHVTFQPHERGDDDVLVGARGGAPLPRAQRRPAARRRRERGGGHRPRPPVPGRVALPVVAQGAPRDGDRTLERDQLAAEQVPRLGRAPAREDLGDGGPVGRGAGREGGHLETVVPVPGPAGGPLGDLVPGLVLVVEDQPPPDLRRDGAVLDGGALPRRLPGRRDDPPDLRQRQRATRPQQPRAKARGRRRGRRVLHAGTDGERTGPRVPYRSALASHGRDLRGSENTRPARPRDPAPDSGAVRHLIIGRRGQTGHGRDRSFLLRPAGDYASSPSDDVNTARRSSTSSFIAAIASTRSSALCPTRARVRASSISARRASTARATSRTVRRASRTTSRVRASVVRRSWSRTRGCSRPRAAATNRFCPTSSWTRMASRRRARPSRWRSRRRRTGRTRRRPGRRRVSSRPRRRWPTPGSRARVSSSPRRPWSRTAPGAGPRCRRPGRGRPPAVRGGRG